MNSGASYCILISGQSEDEEFTRKICAENGMELFHASDAREARQLLFPGVGVFWNLDMENPPQIGLGQLLLEHLDAGRIFGLGDKPLNEYANVLKMRAIGHYFRHGHPTGVEWASRIVGAALRGEAAALGATLTGAPPTVRKLSIARSKDRSIAAEAVSNILAQKSFPPRLAQTVAQCVDELLMNAIFDAPVLRGKHYRLALDRAVDFELKENEIVTLEMTSTDEAILISVTDPFGSLTRGSLLSYLAKDYERIDYRPRAESGAGLGIYGIVDSGVSLSYCVRRQVLTQATLIVPLYSGIKEFRKGFQIFSVIES